MDALEYIAALEKRISNLERYGQSGGDAPVVAEVETGMILPFGGSSAPTGYLLCDGASYLRADYADLFAIIGTSFGAADSTHFNVPDLKDAFLRGTGTSTIFTDNTKGTRSASKTGGATSGIGSKQEDQLQGHKHEIDTNSQTAGGSSGTNMPQGVWNGSVWQATNPNATIISNGNGTPRTGVETRPKNIEVNFVIKT